MMLKGSKKKTKSRYSERLFCMLAWQNGSLRFWCLKHIWCEQMLILGYIDYLPIWTIQVLFSHDLHIYLIRCMKKIAQFILLKIPHHLVRLLGIIQALSIEVLWCFSWHLSCWLLYIHDHICLSKSVTLLHLTYSCLPLNADFFAFINIHFVYMYLNN